MLSISYLLSGVLIVSGITCAHPAMAKKKKMAKRKWSAGVTKHSNALDLKDQVFTLDDPKKINHYSICCV